MRHGTYIARYARQHVRFAQEVVLQTRKPEHSKIYVIFISSNTEYIEYGKQNNGNGDTDANLHESQIDNDVETFDSMASSLSGTYKMFFFS